MNFSLDTARRAAEECKDPAAAYVIYVLIGEVERSDGREAKLEEKILDLQLKLSVLQAPIIGKTIEIQNGVVLDEEFVEKLKQVNKLFDYALHRDRITDGLIDTKGVEKDGLIVDGTV